MESLRLRIFNHFSRTSKDIKENIFYTQTLKESVNVPIIMHVWDGFSFVTFVQLSVSYNKYKHFLVTQCVFHASIKNNCNISYCNISVLKKFRPSGSGNVPIVTMGMNRITFSKFSLMVTFIWLLIGFCTLAVQSDTFVLPLSPVSGTWHLEVVQTCTYLEGGSGVPMPCRMYKKTQFSNGSSNRTISSQDESHS